MSYLIDRLVQRYMVEESWNIIADIDEASPLPNGDELLEEAVTDVEEGAGEERLLEYYQALSQHVNASPLIGGPLPDITDIAEVDGYTTMVVATAPSLRGLKPFCARILMKSTGIAIKVRLFIDGPVPQGLTRQQLVSAGTALREELEEVVADNEEEMDGEVSSRVNSKTRKLQAVPIFFELIQVGSHIDTPAARAVLRELKCSFNRKDKVFISGALLDGAKNQVWTTQGLSGYQRRRRFRYALEHSDQGPVEIREAIHNSTFNWKLVLLAVIIALLATTLKYLLQLKGDLNPLIMLLGDIAIPVVIILGTVSFNRLHYHSVRQTKYFLIGYFGVYISAISWLAWPLSLTLVLYLAKVTLIASFASMWASMMMNLE